MAKINWQFIGPKEDGTPGTFDFTSKVFSMNAMVGRQSYLDNYGSSGITITINNNTGYATRLPYGQSVVIYGAVAGVNYITLTGFVSKVEYSDYNAGTGISTATITMTDVLSYTGRVYANAWTVTQDYATNQAKALEASYVPAGPLPSFIGVTLYGVFTGSILQGQTYTGTVLNYLNASITTERGQLAAIGSTINYVPRSYINNYITAGYSTDLKPTTGTSQLMYTAIQRRAAGTEFINTYTTQPNGLTAQTSTNTTSVSTYGPSTGSAFTYDYNTTQALGNADWIVNSFGDPNTQRIDVQFDDVSQNASGLTYFLNKWNVAVRSFNLTYTPPGGSVTTTTMVMEGASINATPDSTQWTVYLSPLSYYQFFTLDSATLGILDTSRLGW